MPVGLSLAETPPEAARGLVECLYSGKTRRGDAKEVRDLARRLGMDFCLEEEPIQPGDEEDLEEDFFKKKPSVKTQR